MSRCANCGRTMGHSNTVSGEYRADDLPEEYRDGKEDDETVDKYFGDSMCKDVFEEELEVEEKVECARCGDLVKKSEAVKDAIIFDGALKLEKPVHPGCEKEGDGGE